jgi:DNA polymerase III subunit beta
LREGKGGLTIPRIHVTAPVKDLMRVVARAAVIADKKSAMPALANVKLDVTKAGVLSVTATDLYVSIIATHQVKVVEAGALCIDAKDLMSRLSGINGEVQIATTDALHVRISAFGTKRAFVLPVAPASDYPIVPTCTTEESRLVMTAQDLARFLRSTSASISTDEAKPALNSALFEKVGDVEQMIATDGHRLAKFAMKSRAQIATAANRKLLISQSGVTILKGLVEDSMKRDPKGGEEFVLRHDAMHLFVTAQGIVVSIKLVDAIFPSHETATDIMKSYTHWVTVNRACLMDMAKAMLVQAGHIAGSAVGGVTLTVGTNKLTATSNGESGWNAFDEVDAKYSGPPVKADVNVRFLIDALQALDDQDEVLLGINGEFDPVVVQRVDQKEFVALIMPMRI